MPFLEVRSHGARRAIAPARREFAELYAALSPDDQRRLARKRVILDILPKDVPLTDIPGFFDLRHDTSDEKHPRKYDTTRAMTSRYGRVIHSAIDETHVTKPTRNRRFRDYPYLRGYAISHEGSHVVHVGAISRAQNTTVGELYKARMAGDGLWVDQYAKTDVSEYFAESASAFWHRPPFAHSYAKPRSKHPDPQPVLRRYTPAWLRTNDPEMYRLLSEVYPGRAKQIDAHRSHAARALQ